jgi:ribosomal protein S12 methylthiotransferase accessory factor
MPRYEEAQDHTAKSLLSLVQPYGGLFSAVNAYASNPDEPAISVLVARMGNASTAFPQIATRSGSLSSLNGSGSGLTEGDALQPALAEGLERYSACVFHNDQLVWATGHELGDNAIDLNTIPRCSPSELAKSGCPLVVPDKSERIRWIRGLSLLDGTIRYIPAVLVFSSLPTIPSERFWLPISTGCAAHRSYQRALLAALYEVIERDALSIIWLQQLSLRRITFDAVSTSLMPYLHRYATSSPDLEYLFFDATLDLQVPTVYGLQVAYQSRRLRTLVSCGTGITMEQAVAKVIRDMAAFRGTFRREHSVPGSVNDFSDMLHGATYMAHADRRHAFEFLTSTDTRVPLSAFPADRTEDEALHFLVDMLRRHALDVYIVDLTTDEAIRSGMRVLRALIPALQPLSFRYRARFLGHPRLYECPIKIGQISHRECDLNPWPQPFA